jgi:hypothetical protein
VPQPTAVIITKRNRIRIRRPCLFFGSVRAEYRCSVKNKFKFANYTDIFMRKEGDKIPQLSYEKWAMAFGFNADIPCPSSRKK